MVYQALAGMASEVITGTKALVETDVRFRTGFFAAGI